MILADIAMTTRKARPRTACGCGPTITSKATAIPEGDWPENGNLIEIFYLGGAALKSCDLSLGIMKFGVALRLPPLRPKDTLRL
jgi:hypothetical protein